MAWQSTLEQARSIRFGRSTVVGLVAGIGVGLLLGLLIGWVWWPVEWQGATPAATTAAAPAGSQFETPEAKALYLGAVADAFVYGGAAGDADAAAVAAQRLAALGGDLRAAFNNAIDFYNAQAGSTARVNNLTTLAAAFGIPLGGVATAPAAAAPAAQPASGALAAQATAAASAGNNGGSANWLLALLTALILIAGGFYLLWVLKRRQEQGDVGAGFAEEELAPSGAPMVGAFERSTLTPMRSGLTPAASIRSSVDRPQTVQAGGPHGFDAEEPGDFDDSDYDAGEPEDENSSRRFYVPVDAQEDDLLNTEPDASSDANGWDNDLDDDEEEQPERPAAPPPGFVTSVGATLPFTGARSSSPGDPRQPQAADTAQAASAPSAPPRTPPATLQPPTPTRFARYTPVESYTATYYIGRADFDYTKNIQSPSDGSYIGEYGIGIPAGQGLLQNDMEKAIAIEVYLFDKSDERQLVNVKRSLLSLYADNKRADYERDKQSQPPIVAQPNTNFQLEGVQLLLDCQIKQVEYTSEGYFRNVTVELVLKRKS